MKHALIVGATGVVGSAIYKKLKSEGDWKITGLTRKGESVMGEQTIAVDLLNEMSIQSVISKIQPVSHLFFAAYVSRSSRVEEIAPNVEMLKRAIDLAEIGGKLERVVLITGGKHYGVQWGAIKTPARESDARQLAPNFYFDQQDLMAERSAQSEWSWTNLMPPYVTGLASQSPMNLAMVIAVLAVLSQELNLPLRFPGPSTSWTSLNHLADADHIADAACWSAQSSNAKNQIFNVANGDPGRWIHMWPVIAKHFHLESGTPLSVPLTQIPEAFGEVWKKIAERHGLVQADINALVNWKWADYMFNIAFSNDVVLEIGKLRRAGFSSCVDSEAALLQRFVELRDLRLIP